GRYLALTDGVRVAVSRDGGRAFETSDLGPVLALAFAGDDDGAPLLVLTAPRPPATMGAPPGQPGSAPIPPAPACSLSAPARREPARVGDVPGVTASAAMAWDASRDCVWIGCAAGLIALGGARRH